MILPVMKSHERLTELMIESQRLRTEMEKTDEQIKKNLELIRQTRLKLANR
jgi:predicted ATP-grasp superfamily ATP-dependent carboligase